MQYRLSVILAICALATVLAKDKRPLGAEADSDESGEENISDTSTATSTTEPESKIISIINETDLEANINGAGNKLVMIFLMVTWCPYCKKIKPTVEDIAANTDNLVILMVDRDNLKEHKEVWKYGLSYLPSIPRFIFIKNGKKVDEIHGSDSDVRGTVAKYLSSSKKKCESSRNGSESSKSSSESSKSSSESSNSSDE
ncbi:thioredoxin-1-like isoform X2 [Leguminivora glycinivorella]|uniref:thioredoxin-1-like isoform X2 n=1 Tax=Leguminivora glycinivorella TaxID=1035111 RepID=UPI00200F36F1|nr:thioredoxin-1-like isoform X2 [Leguminivora glycinivorella]